MIAINTLLNYPGAKWGMPNNKVPNKEEQKILKENGLVPEDYAVTYRTDTEIYLLCYKTRDQVVIRKGDRPW